MVKKIRRFLILLPMLVLISCIHPVDQTIETIHISELVHGGALSSRLGKEGTKIRVRGYIFEDKSLVENNEYYELFDQKDGACTSFPPPTLRVIFDRTGGMPEDGTLVTVEGELYADTDFYIPGVEQLGLGVGEETHVGPLKNAKLVIVEGGKCSDGEGKK